MNIKQKLISLAVVSFLSACGGGGGGSTGGTTNPTSPGNTSSDLQSSCTGTNCGSTDGANFSSGVGIWHATNDTDSEKIINVNVNLGVAANLYGVYTNTSDALQNFASSVSRNVEPTPTKTDEEIRHEKNRQVLKQLVVGSKEKPLSLVQKQRFSVGQSTTLIHESNGSDTSTSAILAYSATAADGRLINYWVQSSEYGVGKVTDTLITQLHNNFAAGANSAYMDVTTLAGKPWGTHVFSNMIDDQHDLNVFISNLTPDGQGFGLMGYFWGGDTMTKASNPLSNEMLMIHADSETLYKSSQGPNYIASTLSHELTHTSNFYQRDIAPYDPAQDIYYGFDTAMEETSAVMMQDITASKTGFSPSQRLMEWLNMGATNCDLSQFSSASGCSPYAVHAAWGSFFLRKYGIGSYVEMLNDLSATDLPTQFDKRIKGASASSKSFSSEVGEWMATSILLQRTNVPTSFSYPASTQSVTSLGDIQLSDLQQTVSTSYASWNNIGSASAPSALNPYGGSHVVKYGAQSSSFTKTISIPPHSTYRLIAVQ